MQETSAISHVRYWRWVMLDGWIDTQVAVDLDDMMKVCRLAKQKGYGSREYLEFTTMMLDSFSHIYKTCQIVNREQPNVRDKLVSLELENKTLREALGSVVELCVTHIGADYTDEVHRRYLLAKQALSTPPSTEHLEDKP